MLEKDGRLVTPSAVRNAPAIIEFLKRANPKSGRALKAASGTGQHIIKFAGEFLNLSWQPTDLDPKRIKSIKLWIKSGSLNNIRDPIALDATEGSWHARFCYYHFVVLVNLSHLLSWKEIQA